MTGFQTEGTSYALDVILGKHIVRSFLNDQESYRNEEV